MNKLRFLIRAVMFCLVVGIVYSFLNAPRVIRRLLPQKSINVLAWPAVLDASEFSRFEKETGIKVYLTYFENYEELVVKMRAGAGDYDLVMTSDYAVHTLVQEGIVKPIDKSQLHFWNTLYSSLLNLYFDPGNKYTIPFAWEMYGIGVDTNQFDAMPRASWDLLFKKGIAPRNVGMLDDTRETISIAALYLFGKDDSRNLTLEQLEQIKALLLKQKSWVAMYTDLRTDYLLVSQTAPAVMGVSSDIYQARHECSNVEFLLPQEGSFILIDHFMIPASTQKDALVYQFLNFLYQPDILRAYADKYSFFPVREGITTKNNRYLLTPSRSLLSRLSFFNYIIPEELMRFVWITLKS